MSRPLTIKRHPETAMALVAMVIDGATSTDGLRSELAQWKLVNPLADWIAIDMRAAPPAPEGAWLRRTLSELIESRHMQFGQLVLLGRHNAGRIALNLILEGALACAGIVGVDIPCASPRTPIVPTTASIRLVAHDGEQNRTNGANLIDALRRSDIDTRIMMLPSVGLDGVEATVRAAGTFLFELVAKASSYATSQGRSRHV